MDPTLEAGGWAGAVAIFLRYGWLEWNRWRKDERDRIKAEKARKAKMKLEWEAYRKKVGLANEKGKGSKIGRGARKEWEAEFKATQKRDEELREKMGGH